VIFRNIAVLGLDAVSLSLALAARRTWPAALVIGVDGPERLEEAVRLHAIDVGAPDLAILAGAELIVLACLPEERLGQLQRLCEYVEAEAVVTDLGGPKASLLECARTLERLSFVGSHPMVRPAPSGNRVASERFAGVPWFVTPDPADPRPGAVERLVSFVAALGARPELLYAEEYDRRLSGNRLTARDTEIGDD